jgi:carboxymethylenebutenolidase
MRAALQEAKQPAEIVLYPDTPHGFYADYRPTYRPKEAADAFQRMLDWFEKHGVGAK